MAISQEMLKISILEMGFKIINSKLQIITTIDFSVMKLLLKAISSTIF